MRTTAQRHPVTSVSPSHSLKAKIRTLRHKLVLMAILQWLSVAIMATLTLFAVVMLIDWLFEIPSGSRTVILCMNALILAALAFRVLAAPWHDRKDEQTLALLVESANPELASRLIASVQLTGSANPIAPGTSAALVKSLVAETEVHAQSLSFGKAVETKLLKQLMLAAGAVLLVAAGVYVSGGPVTSALLQRAFLAEIPIPRSTRVPWTSGAMKVGLGDTIEIQARAEGVIPKSGRVTLKFASGRSRELVMKPVEGASSTFAVTVDSVPESFHYFVRIHDGRSAKQYVKAIARPEVTTVRAVQTYPSYTRLPPAPLDPGEFILFAGSRFDLEVLASKPISNAALTWISGDTLAFDVDPQNPKRLTTGFTVATDPLSGFALRLIDREGMKSVDSTVYRLDYLEDDPPTVRILHPTRSDELVTRKARVMISFEAKDRFGIARVELRFAINGTEPQAYPFELAGETPVQLCRHYEWPLPGVRPPLAEGDVVEYWIAAHDLKPDSVPGLSSRRSLKVVSVSEKRQDLLGRAADYLGGIGQVATDQERLNRELGSLIRRAPTLNPE